MGKYIKVKKQWYKKSKCTLIIWKLAFPLHNLQSIILWLIIMEFIGMKGKVYI